MFAGVLDGGDAEVSLGGSRLSRFMETVEKATAALGAPLAAPVETAGVGERAAADGEAGTDGAGAARELSPAAPTSPTRDDDPLARLLEGGLELLGELARAARTPVGDGGRAAQADGVFRVARDPMTGEAFLRVRLPRPMC